MHRLSTSDRARAIACLVDGNSQRATCRIMDLSRKAVARLVEGKMNFNESDFRSGCGRCYSDGTSADGRPKYCLHVHSNAVFNFRPVAPAPNPSRAGVTSL